MKSDMIVCVLICLLGVCCSRAQQPVPENLTKQNAQATNEKQVQVITDDRLINIEHSLIALAITVIILFYLLIGSGFIADIRLIQFVVAVAVLISFELLNMLLHPFLRQVTDDSSVLMILALLGAATLIATLHHKLAGWSHHKLNAKNKKIRLAAARKMINNQQETTS